MSYFTNPCWESRLNSREQDLLRAEIGAVEPRVMVRSSTRGLIRDCWWCRTPLWVCVTEHDVIMSSLLRGGSYLQRLTQSLSVVAVITATSRETL